MVKHVLIIFLTFVIIPLHAADISDLSYDTIGDTVIITECETSATGELIIQDTIGGKPVTSIGGNAFFGCTSLTSITIPESVVSIGDSAFAYCTSLTSVTIPDSVTSIGNVAFGVCESLTSIMIPDGVTIIGNLAFIGCTSLTSITIPDSVTTIGGYTFSDCSKLTSIDIPDSVTIIGSDAFSGCSSLSDITIPDGVTSIEVGTFSGCTSLTRITIPESVVSIGDSAFAYCTSLTSITFKGNAPTFGVTVFLKVPTNAKVFIYEGASGFNSWEEFGKFLGMPLVVRKKSNPPKIISFVSSGDVIPMSSLTITFTSSSGSNYAIERSRDLVNWVTLLVIAGEESSTEFTDNEPINDGEGVYYRVREKE